MLPDCPALALLASRTPDAQQAARDMMAHYTFVTPAEADVIVVLGGDGFMLETLHKTMKKKQKNLWHESGDGGVSDEQLCPRGIV